MTRPTSILSVATAMALLAMVFAACGGGDAPGAGDTGRAPMADMAAGTPAGDSADEHADHGLVAVTEDDGQTVRYWTCVMHPSVQMSEPGTCPVCNMDLIAIYEGEGLTLTDRQRDLLPVRTEEVTFRKLEREIRTVGALEYNETTLAYVSTRISGWIEDLMLDFTGVRVREGDELLTIYSPELVAAQEEYLAAARGAEALGSTHLVALQQTAERTVDAARRKLELYGLTPGQIEMLRGDGVAKTELPLYAPVGGTVIHMNVAKGQHVARGANLFRIADLSTLWIKADVYEYEVPWLYMGQSVDISTEAMPGQSFTGEVTYIYPFMDAPTRTQKVKIEVGNADGAVRPGMYATIRLRPTLAEIYARETHPDEPYACPMHPWITSDHPTDCAICGMDLEPTRPDMATAGPTQTMFVCPMHPDVQESEPGECPICGMDLVKTDVASTATASATIFTCPMHPDVQLSEPGACPVCGLDLVETEADPHAGHDHAAPGPAVPSAGDTMARAPKPARGPALIFRYACPDHPDDYATVPGRCPKDGKTLVMTGEVLAVPKSAIIDTGLRKIVFIDRGDSGYEQVEVEVGPEAWAVGDGSAATARRRYFPVITGLNPSDPVVTNGNFLLDSQTQLTGSASGAYGGALGGDEESSAPAHNH